MKPVPFLVLLIGLPALAFAQSAHKLSDKMVVPVPQARPDRQIEPTQKPGGDATDMKNEPLATDDASDKGKNDVGNSTGGTAEAPSPAPPPEKEDPKKYAACIAALRKTGINFTEAEGFDDGGGCGIDKPLIVREVLPGIRLEPEAKLRCETALQLSRWAKGAVLPAAKLAFAADGKVTAFHQASSYVCRKRDSLKDGKLSEHAKGNAIDIDRFIFSNKTSVGIEPRAKDSTLTGAFQRAIVASGCLYFTTVLGPQSDGFHKTHIHLDVVKRHGGYRYCW